MQGVEVGLADVAPGHRALPVDDAVRPARAFGGARAERGNPASPLRWTTEDEGSLVQHDHEPLTTPWRRALSRLLQWIAPDELL